MPDAPRLYLITPLLAEAATFALRLEAALAAADVACVLIRAATPDRLEPVARALAPVIQRHEVAALIEAEPRLAARYGLDGLHVVGAGALLDEAVAALKPQRIVGVGDLATRDDAMRAGEAGVDYLMFGGPDAPHDETCESVAWWAEIFNVPCIGYAHGAEQAHEIAVAGAEFVALGDALWARPETIAATLAAISRAVALEPTQ